MCLPCQIRGVVRAVVRAFGAVGAVVAFVVGGYLAKALLWRQANPTLPWPVMLMDRAFWTRDDIWVFWGLVIVSTLLVPVVGVAVLWWALRWTGWVAWARVRGLPAPRPQWLQRAEHVCSLCCSGAPRAHPHAARRLRRH